MKNTNTVSPRPSFLPTSWGDYCERRAHAVAHFPTSRALCLSPVSVFNPLGKAFASTHPCGFGLSNCAGGYVTRGGEVSGLFRNPVEASAGMLPELLGYARSLGGWWLNCYAFPGLLEAYERNGFSPVVFLPFSPRYAPRGWEETALAHRPPVAFCVDREALDNAGDMIPEMVNAWEDAVCLVQRFNPRPTLSRTFLGGVGQTVSA